MPRTFAYARVSTTGQTTDNQEIEAAGFHVEPRRIVTETRVWFIMSRKQRTQCIDDSSLADVVRADQDV